MDPDETLRILRRSIIKWEQSPSGSVEEADAAESATSSAAALDQWLSRGGALPAAWANAQPATGGVPVQTEPFELVPPVITDSRGLA